MYGALAPGVKVDCGGAGRGLTFISLSGLTLRTMRILDIFKRLFAPRRGVGRDAGAGDERAPSAPVLTSTDAAESGGSPAEDEVDFDPFNPFPDPVRLEITDTFDLHTIPPRAVVRVVEEYLSEARRACFRSVRLIHGKGKGVQRAAVRKVLARTPFVRDWADAPPQAGGLGATVAHLLADKDA